MFRHNLAGSSHCPQILMVGNCMIQMPHKFRLVGAGRDVEKCRSILRSQPHITPLLERGVEVEGAATRVANLHADEPFEDVLRTSAAPVTPVQVERPVDTDAAATEGGGELGCV